MSNGIRAERLGASEKTRNEETHMVTTSLIHPEIIAALARCGHGSKILIADGNYPLAEKSGEAAKVFLGLRRGLPTVMDVLSEICQFVNIEAAAVMVPEQGPEPEIFPESDGARAESSARRICAPGVLFPLYGERLARPGHFNRGAARLCQHRSDDRLRLRRKMALPQQSTAISKQIFPHQPFSARWRKHGQ